MTNQTARSLWLPHRSFSPLSNCLITRHRLFAKSKSKLNRRLKLALAKLAMILIIMIERVGRGSSTGTSRARTGRTDSKKPSTSGWRRGRQQLANLCSSLVSSLPPHRIVVISSLGLSVCAQLLSLPIEMGATNRREILEHSSGWRRKRNCSRMGHTEQGGGS